MISSNEIIFELQFLINIINLFQTQNFRYFIVSVLTYCKYKIYLIIECLFENSHTQKCDLVKATQSAKQLTHQKVSWKLKCFISIS